MKEIRQAVIVLAGGLLAAQLILVVPMPASAQSRVDAERPAAPAPATTGGGTEGLASGCDTRPCAQNDQQARQADDKGDPALGGERHPLYRLAKSDTIDITFTLSPEFNQTLTVQPDGYVVLRDAGPLLAEGLTVTELQRAIVKACGRFLHEPQVSVVLKDFERPYFLASGEVARPGKYELRSDLTVNEAVAIAGGFTQQARHSQVVLFRRVSADTAEAHVLDVKKMLNRRDLREDWHLRPGDFIYVPQSRISKIRRFVPASSTNWYLNPLQF